MCTEVILQKLVCTAFKKIEYNLFIHSDAKNKEL